MKYHDQDIVLTQNENKEYDSVHKDWLMLVSEDHKSNNRERITIRHVSDTSVQEYRRLKYQAQHEERHLYELTDRELARAIKTFGVQDEAGQEGVNQE